MRKAILILIILIFSSVYVFAEEKPTEMVPKLTVAETADAPVIVNSEVYPFWGYLAPTILILPFTRMKKGANRNI